MSNPKLHEVETIKVIHADGSEGETKLRIIGIPKSPAGTPKPEASMTNSK